MEHRVYVYGSLRVGEPNHGVLARHDAQFIAAREISGYLMHAYCASFPAVYASHDLQYGKIVVEEYAVSDACLRDLDRLEGHPAFYRRIRTIGGAWIYVMREERVKRVGAPRVFGGDWVRYRDRVELNAGGGA